MYTDVTSAMQAVNALVDQYSVTCLWLLREDY
jgi:hypothetical protein